MANLQTAADILDDALFRCGEATDGTSDFNAAAIRYLNRAYSGIWLGGRELVPDIQEAWKWLRKYPPGVLTLTPSISAGTLAVTNNNTAITFSSGPTPSVADWYLKVDTHEDVFRISAHTALDTAATLDSVYTGVDAAAATYRVYKLDYALTTDVLRVLSPMRAFRAERRYEITGVDMLALDRDYPVALAESGIPDHFANVEESTVRFNRHGGTEATSLIRVEYDYLYRPAVLTDAAVEPVVPWQWRSVLSDWVTGWLMLDKADSRAGAVLEAARAGLIAMAAENRHQQQTQGVSAFGAIRTRQDQYQRDVRGPVRTQSGLIIG